MSIVEPSDRSGIIARIKGMLTQPTQTWDEIDTEPATISGLYSGYAAPLAGVAAVAGLLSQVLWGARIMGVVIRNSFGSALGQALLSFVMGLAAVALLAVVIDFLAPKFGGTASRIQAFKLAVYSMTAGWVGAVLVIVPWIGWLVSLAAAIYSLYALYKGLPKLMKSQEDKTTPYFVVILLVLLVVGAVFAGVSARFGGFGGPLRTVDTRSTITIPGKATVDLGELESQAQQAQAAVKQMQSGDGPQPLDPEVLKAFLPASVAGFARTELSAGGGEVAGMKGSSAKASYRKGDAHIKLSVTDMGAAGALAGLVGAFNVKSSEAADDHYEKVGKVEGRMTQEKYDRSSRAGEYSMMVGDKFMVQATGEGVSIDDLKAAVHALDIPRLEAQAKAG